MTKRRVLLIIVAGVFISLNAGAAGKVTLNGSATTSSPADFVQVSIQIHSRCYPSPVEAASENAKAANRIKKVMDEYAKGERDQILISGGFTYKDSIVQYERDGSAKTLCTGYSQTNNLVLKIADFKAWPAFQNQVVEKISEPKARGSSTEIQLGQPIAGLYPENLKNLELAALRLAAIDASQKLEAIAAICGLKEIQILDIQADSRQIRPIPSESAPMMADKSKDLAPELSFDPLQVSKTLTVSWAFESSARSCEDDSASLLNSF